MWKTVKLGDVCILNYGKALDKKDRLENAAIPVYGANGIKTYSNKLLHDKPSIIIGRKGSAGELNKVTEPFWALDVTYYVTTDESIVNLDFLFYTLVALNLPSMARGVKPGINRNDVYDKSINLPSLSEQESIVTKLDAAFAEIDKIATNTQQKLEEAQKLYASGITDIYFSNKSVPVVPLSKIAKIKGGKRLPKGKKLQPEPTNYPYIRVSDFTDYGTIDEKSIKYITEEIHSEISRYTISSDDVYISIAGTIGKTGIIPQSLDGANLTENAAKIMLNEECDKDYFYFFTTSSSFEKQAIAQTRTAAQPKLALERLKAVELPIHNKISQQAIAEKARSVRDKVRLAEKLLSKKLVQIQALKSAILKQELQPSEAA